MHQQACAGSRPCRSWIWSDSHLALQGADLEGLKGLASLITVADILEGLSGVLAGNVEQDLLTTSDSKRPG